MRSTRIANTWSSISRTCPRFATGNGRPTSSMKVSPLAGTPVDQSQLVDVPRLITAYYSLQPDPDNPAQRVSFGTSGHRGSAFDSAFNEAHILAISQAICLYRK